MGIEAYCRESEQKMKPIIKTIKVYPIIELKGKIGYDKMTIEIKERVIEFSPQIDGVGTTFILPIDELMKHFEGGWR